MTWMEMIELRTTERNRETLFRRRFWLADDEAFERAVEQPGTQCVLLKRGKSVQGEEMFHETHSD
jgi:hypothetical protein